MKNFLDGKKTYIGLAMIAGYYVGKSYGIPMPDGLLNTGYGLAAVGIAHKLDKVKTAVEGLKGETK